MSMNKSTIKIQDLSIGYINKGNSPKIVAQKINGEIKQKELTCLLGANGIGKSTLLRTLSGFQKPLHGNILINEKDVGDYSDSQLSTIIGVVLTEKCNIKNMTVSELVGLGRSPYTGFWGKLNAKDRTIVNQCIEKVNIEHLSDRMIHTLSDGECQKAMIAKALAQETPIIFLDEPTAFLDFPSKVEIMQLLHQLSRSTSKTIFLSTHDLELALQISDKIWLMDYQQDISIGTPEDLALQGKLGHFFENRGIFFDWKSGLFRIENKYRAHIRLTGHGQKYAMARKALQRNGIEANRNIESEVSIDCGNLETLCYTLIHPNQKSQTVNSLDDLLQCIAKIEHYAI